MSVPILASRLHPTAMMIWFDDIVPESFNGETMVLSTTTEVKKKYLESKFLPIIKEVFTEIFSEEIEVIINVIGQKVELSKEYEESDENEEKYTFSNFIVGTSNEFAHSASKAVAKAVATKSSLNDPSYKFNPLYLYGNSGLGKTHLMNSIASIVIKERKDAKIIYIKCEEFTNDLIASIGNGNVSDFRDKYRQADLLLIDDVQFMAGKKQSQEEFFHTFDTLYNDNKQIVFTSDKPPKEINNLEDRLATRFGMGLIADVSPPDYETRIAIIKALSLKQSIEMPDDVCEYIATTLNCNVRQIEGAVNKICGLHKLTEKTINKELAEKSVKDVIIESKGVNPTPEIIVQEVTKYYNISSDKIMSKNKTKDTVEARQVAMYLVRELTNYSLPETGKYFQRDHTTVMHAISKIEKQIKEHETMKSVIDDLIKNIRDL